MAIIWTVVLILPSMCTATLLVVVTHAYVVIESAALVRSRLGPAAVIALLDDLLPAIRVEMVDRSLHEGSLADHRRMGGGTSVVDRVTLAFAARHGIQRAFAFDADLVSAGLAAVGARPPQ